jgi:hypothetical protein
MKKLLAIALALALGLAWATTQAMAGPSIEPKKSPGPPFETGTPGTPAPHQPGPPSNPGAPSGQGALVTPGAQATAHADLHGKPTILRGTLTALDAASLTLQQADGTSVTVGLTPETRIRVPGPNAGGDTLLVGMHVVVMAVADSNNQLVARAVMAVPGQPVLTHRVGIVTAYTAGSSITIQATDGNAYTFGIQPDAKILPPQQAASLAVGSNVTVIAPRVPAESGWTAIGIVVHRAQP